MEPFGDQPPAEINLSQDQEHKKPLVAVLGPTGAGKSYLALQLACEFGGEVVNCDSIQIYRGLDVGSAKLSPVERRAAPHHLIDILEPSEELTAGIYAYRARLTLADISARKSLPIVAGGTGFYLRALFDGLSPAPQRDEHIRKRLRKLAERRPDALFRYLRRFDPASARSIHANDHQKLIRTIEMMKRAGKRASTVKAAPRDALQGYSILKLGVWPDRAELYELLNRRSAEMFRNGLLEETKGLLDAGLPPESRALGSLGYKQAVQVLMARMPLEAAVKELQTRTRQYAKRQMTWFRNERDVQWLHGLGSDSRIIRQAFEMVRRFLGTNRP